MISDKERLEYGEDRYNVGLAEGDRRRALIAASKMKAKGMSYEDIAEGTDLSIDEIASL